MKRHEIHEWSLGYWLIRLYTICIHRIYYKEIVVLGRENIPAAGPVIFSPNHQNALMDALAIVCTVPQQLVFLARADLFQQSFVARILTFLKIMPIYRIRDGYGNLSRNEECFENAVAILNERKSLCLMPEGNHGNRRKLRPFSKGLFRIAFRAQNGKGNVPFVKIVPVGIDYSHYSRFRARLIIHFGTPIDVSVYFSAYRNSPAKAYKELCDHLRSEMKSLMLHVESATHYETIWALKDICRHTMIRQLDLDAKNTFHIFSADQQLLASLDRMAALEDTCLSQIEKDLDFYRRLSGELKLRPWILNNGGIGFMVAAGKCILCVLYMPVFLYGFLNNLISCFIVSRLSGLPKDPQFRSSFRFVAIMFLVPLINLIQTLLFYGYCHSFVWCTMYFVSIYLSGLIAFDFYVAAMKYISLVRYRIGLHFKGSKYLALTQMHGDLISLIHTRIY
jgi:1-acyl-sn-glycerol-3-phosphate acyltransferase